MRYHWLFALSFITFVLLADFAMAESHWDEMLVKHTWNDVPANWESLGNTTAGAMIKLHIALKHDREGALIDTLYEVSNPEHPRYGAYLSREQLAELVSPNQETLDLVRSWLIHHGIRPSSISTSHDGSWLTVTDVLVSQANQLLGASYQQFRNLKTNETIIRTVGYALPAILHTHIRTVAPTTYFPSSRGMRQTLHNRTFGGAPASGKGVKTRQLPGITPSFLRWLYKTNAYRPYPPYLSKIGVLGIYDDYPSQPDLNKFMADYRSDGINAKFSVRKWNGGRYNPNDPFDIASIGVQYPSAIAYPMPLTFYSVGGDMQWDPDTEKPIAGDMYSEWLNKLGRELSPPKTVSIGFGETEWDLPRAYADALCELFAGLGSRGVTFLAASGIVGVGAGECRNPNRLYQFAPEFPSSCPYVTSVGATTLARPEQAANMSGGGFSSHFDRPPYQDVQVLNYLSLFPDLNNGLYNRHGRGYPDISAQALHYQFIMNGEMRYLDGTACSVSTVAGIIALYNDYRISTFRPSVGFLNPLLYSTGFRGLNDIEWGLNPGCGTDGFMAAPGWDPVSGMGTPDFSGMLNH